MKMNNIFKAALISMLGLALAGCANEFDYTPAEMEDASKTFVRVDETAPRNLDVDGSDIIVPFVRNNASGALDITVELTDPSGIFTLKNSTVSFADGQTTANAAVSYSYDALVPETVYNITVAMTSGPSSEYAAIAFPVACKKAWQNLGMAQWYDDWFIGGPYEKQLLKAPDGTETYRLMDPWDKATVAANGFTPGAGIPYLEFVVNEDGSISYSKIINLGFIFSGMSTHMLHPSGQNDAASTAKNLMVMENVAQFCWYPILNYTGSGFSWWGTTSVAFISFPGGPDLAELLGL